MKTTFGARLKKCRKDNGYTQQELAEIIGVSVQAVSKWETDAGMPDISQIVPLSRALNVSADMLLGIADESAEEEFNAVHRKCMAIESCGPSNWPPKAEAAEKGFCMMYDFFSMHPNNPHAAKYLLDMAEMYWGKFNVFADEASAVKECERFAICIFRNSNDADLLAEARFLIASIWTRAGQTEKANDALSKMPFRYGDRCYWSAEVAEKAGDFEQVEALCKESFTHRARFISRCLRLMARLPSKTEEEKIEYEEYMLRLINAFLTGGDGMPYRQIYQKLSLLSGLVKRNWRLKRIDRALDCFQELIETAEAYLAFLDGGCNGTTLLLLDDAPEPCRDTNGISFRREMVSGILHRTVDYGRQMTEAERNDPFSELIIKAEAICKRISEQ